MDRRSQKEMLPQFQVAKVFPQRGYFQLHRLLKPAAFTCNRCSLQKVSKLVAFAKDKCDEPICNGCYGYVLASEVNDCVRSTPGNMASRQSHKTSKGRKFARHSGNLEQPGSGDMGLPARAVAGDFGGGFLREETEVVLRRAAGE